MKRTKFLLVFVSLIFVLQELSVFAQEARSRFELLNLIRKDKFDLVLPKVMRDNNVDMWIHVIRRGDPDPLELDLGGNAGYFVFTDRGGDRIERAVLGIGFSRIADKSVYDIITEENLYGEDQIPMWKPSDLTEFVAERDPKRIAVNMSDWLTHTDGLSHTGYLKLVGLLGKKYAERLVSSETVITDFRVRRVQTEVIAFAKACEIQRQIMETALKSIKPAVTTREELAWWAQDKLLKHGLPMSYLGASMPGISHSEVSDRSETSKLDYAFQRGDLISWDWGIKYLNFGTDYKRKAYILKEGETSLPSGLQHAWDRGLKAREIIRTTFKSGHTAGEILKIVSKAIEDAGYVYTPYVNNSRNKEIIEALGDSEESGFSIDCHCVGNTGNSQIAVGPSMAPFRKGRAHLIVRPNNLIAFEFMVHTWIPEWNRRLSINFEDNAIVTERGIEALYPRNEQIILVR
ncbi:MAG: M24 family metallopeptidase [Candidatus Aminicenantes bacterium]|jgi:Xaa-Pro aminopeptidase